MLYLYKRTYKRRRKPQRAGFSFPQLRMLAGAANPIGKR